MSSVDRLVEVIALLRGHCPWMAALTHESLVEYLVEESYELVEAIEGGRGDDIKGELGDVLLQVVLHARLAEEAGRFSFDDVASGLAEKMVRRNPHVFRPDGSLQDSFPATVEEIELRWHEVKKSERSGEDSPFLGLPASLPALALARKSLDRARRAGLRMPEPAGVPEPADEAALGELLLGLSVQAQALGLDAERALRDAVRRFQTGG